MIITANIIPSKHPVWALRFLMELPFDRDVVLPDERLEEIHDKLRSYCNGFETYAQTHRYFWNEHELSVMERVFLITSQDCNPILYVMNQLAAEDEIIIRPAINQPTYYSHEQDT